MTGRGFDARTDGTVRLVTLGRHALDRVSGGALGQRLGTGPVLWLGLTVGRRRHTRTTPVVYARDPRGTATETLIVAAPRAGGRRTASWVSELRAHIACGAPVSVTIGTRSGDQEGDLTVAARAEEVPAGPEQDRCWALILAERTPGTDTACEPAPAAVFRLLVERCPG